MKILIATDAWEPQINGVARTLKQTTTLLEKMGHSVQVIHPGMFKSIACPFTKDVRLAWVSQRKLKQIIDTPDAIHISTEGTIGLAVRHFCVRHGLRFTTAYHTRISQEICSCSVVDYTSLYEMVSRSILYSDGNHILFGRMIFGGFGSFGERNSCGLFSL